MLFAPVVMHIARRCVGYSWCDHDGELLSYSCKSSKNYKRFLELVPEASACGRDAMAFALAARKSKRLLQQVLVECAPARALVGREMLSYTQYPSNQKRKDVVGKVLSAAAAASTKCREIMRQTPDAKSLDTYYRSGSTGKGPKADELANLLVNKWAAEAKTRGFYLPAIKKNHTFDTWVLPPGHQEKPQDCPVAVPSVPAVSSEGAAVSAPVPAPEPSNKKRKAADAGMGEARDKLYAALVAFYKIHNPSKIKVVRQIIDMYTEKHGGDMDVVRSAIFADIKKTYNAIPSP